MANKKRPTKSTLKKRSNIVDLKNKQKDQSEVSAEKLEGIKRIQQQIDEFNRKEIFDIDPFFNTLSLTGEKIIVRLFQENFIKYLDESDSTNPQVDAYIRMIDGRKRTSDTPNWLPTPFPYIQEGVIVALSPELQLNYHKLNEELDKFNSENKVHVPQVGDIVRIRPYNSQWYKEHRYYISKQEQCEDFVFNTDEIRLRKFQGYFECEPHEIEAFIPKADYKMDPPTVIEVPVSGEVPTAKEKSIAKDEPVSTQQEATS